MERRKLLITGCGRSGTSYVVKLFRECGYDVQHEQVGSFGCVSMYMITPITDCTIVNKGQKTPIHNGECRSQYSFDHVWHQIRDPLKTIDSLAKAFTHKVRLWTGEVLSVPLPGLSSKRVCPLSDKLRWAMHYYVIGNQLAAEQASYSYQLETMNWSDMMSRLGLPPHTKPSMNTTINRGLRYAFRSKEQIAQINATMYDTTWEMLYDLDYSTAFEVASVASKFGYSV